MHAVQNTLSKELDISSFPASNFKISKVIGSFWADLLPLTRLTPFKIEVTYQLFSSGFVWPELRCVRRTAFKYCLIELKLSRRDKKAMYLPKFSWDNGTGGVLIFWQN